MRLATRLGSLVLTLTVAGTVCAQVPPKTAKPLKPTAQGVEFRTLDKNGDGRISSAESKANVDLRANFDTLDKNHDGYLTPIEFAAWTEAANANAVAPVDPSTGPSGSSGAQHMPDSR
jgi:hypothetical protein